MRYFFYITASLHLVLILLNTQVLKAQAPSDTVTAAPSTTAAVGKLLLPGQTITLNGPKDANNTDFPVYHWYKQDASGNMIPLKGTSRTYTETPGNRGYYNYQLITENSNGCTSPTSDIYKIYVFPPITATVVSSNSSVCATPGSTTSLTANITSASNYSFSYQWTRNGVAISGATSNTYTVTGEATAGTITYAVKLSYTLTPTYVVSATKDIVVAPLLSKPMITAN